MRRTLALESVQWSAHQLVMRFALGELKFGTTYWYPDIDLRQIEAQHGREFAERIFVHAALFELNKLASLRPSAVDLGPYARHHTRALEALWREVFHKVWAQWRYENGLPDEPPPPFAHAPVADGTTPVRRHRVSDELLLFSGGGKDSLVSMKLLERAELPFATFAYAASAYGTAAPQRALLDGLLAHGRPARCHRQVVLDDVFDAPLIELFGDEVGVRTLTAAETPSSIFAALPVLLAGGYARAVLGHEASANRGNLRWDATGEEVNHQWGKSVEAEARLDEYVRAQLVADGGVFSVLMPIHDVVIFELLRRDQSAVPAAHSCNVRKPWCRRCAKCAYVWLGYRAHLPTVTVDEVFGEELLEVAENEVHFRALLGVAAHTPFECVGQVDESRLALSLIGARGLLGPRGRALLASLPPLDLSATLDRYLRVDVDGARLPPEVAAGVLPQMREAAESARARIVATLAGALR